jgi:hypothetical protein
VKLSRLCPESDNHFGLASLIFHPRYLSVSETWMVDMRPEVEDLRYNSTRAAFLIKPGYDSGYDKGHQQTYWDDYPLR